MNISNYMPTKVISGRNCLEVNSDVFSSFGDRALILTGKTSAISCGALDVVTSILKNIGIEFRIFDSVEQNPSTSTCHFCGFIARSFNADFIIGIGGGSVMDAAKAVAIYAKNPQLSQSDIYLRDYPSKKLPVVLVGTTAGTGSEVTGVSVLTNSETGLKKSISGIDCYSDISFCDYSFTKTANLQTRISTALDAFAHAVESYFSSTANDISMMYSVKALEYLSDYVINNKFDCLIDEDFEKLYIASVYAGYAINITGTCFPHTVGYYLTENYGIPHGRACTAFFPVLFKKAKENCPERVETILRVLNCSECDLLNPLAFLTNVEIEIEERQAREISARWSGSIKNFDRTPGGFSVEEAAAALSSLG